MRRRIGIAGMTGLGGNSSPSLMENKGKLTPVIKKMMKEAWETFPLMKEYKGCDFDISDDEIRFGIEPSYMYDHLEMITIRREKGYSSKELGYCRGPWGSNVCSTKKYYKEYKRKSKFTRFVDKWHSLLFKQK